jgi:hypothetical protein
VNTMRMDSNKFQRRLSIKGAAICCAGGVSPALLLH